MIRTKWFLHPILIFIASIVAVASSLALYIYWYVEASTGLKKVIQKGNLDPDQVLAPQTWLVILVLSILVGIILLGIFIIFVYNQKTFQLYRLQRNFINNFTHELKTPVASIKLYLETFQRYELSREDRLKYIEYMVQDADRLSHNINRILKLAKIESKTQEDKFQDTDLIQFIKDFYQKNRHLFSKCELVIQNPSGKTFVYSISRSLLEILLMNLFTNAIKYNQSDVPRIDVVFKPGRRNLKILFEDNGIGIPKSESRKIFKKFYQIGKSDDRSAKGTGIGLYLVDSIAKAHDGKITSRPREKETGTVFSLSLPLKKVHTKMIQ